MTKPGHFLLVCLLLADSAMAAPEQEDEFIFPDDDLAERIAAMNEGQLEFLTESNAEKIFHSYNSITIDENSTTTGWVKLKQCYHHLDPVGKIEIVYQYKQHSNLAITSYKNIGKATIKNNNIELEDVLPDASICMSADIQNFYKASENEYVLVNGPYHRKYFDGYFPFHLTLDIHYPKSLISFTGSTPNEQAGFIFQFSDNHIQVDTTFEGILETRFHFSRI